MAWDISRINTATISDITLLSARSQQLYTPYTHNIWYHLPICPVTTSIHTIYPQYLISPYSLSRHNSYTHHIPTISDITLLSVRAQQLYTPYTHNIWYHLTVCPVTKAIHTIYPQYLISPWYLSGRNSYTHHPSTEINDLESPLFIYDSEGQSFRISFRNWLLTFLNTSLLLATDIPLTGNISQYVISTYFWHSN
jgi:hypothetical protein